MSRLIWLIRRVSVENYSDVLKKETICKFVWERYLSSTINPSTATVFIFHGSRQTADSRLRDGSSRSHKLTDVTNARQLEGSRFATKGNSFAKKYFFQEIFILFRNQLNLLSADVDFSLIAQRNPKFHGVQIHLHVYLLKPSRLGKWNNRKKVPIENTVN
jgi:hypothetical protein